MLYSCTASSSIHSTNRSPFLFNSMLALACITNRLVELALTQHPLARKDFVSPSFNNNVGKQSILLMMVELVVRIDNDDERRMRTWALSPARIRFSEPCVQQQSITMRLIVLLLRNIFIFNGWKVNAIHPEGRWGDIVVGLSMIVAVVYPRRCVWNHFQYPSPLSLFFTAFDCLKNSWSLRRDGMGGPWTRYRQ